MLQAGKGLVPAAVIDADNLVGLGHILENRRQARKEGVAVFRLIEHRRHDRQFRQHHLKGLSRLDGFLHVGIRPRPQVVGRETYTGT